MLMRPLDVAWAALDAHHAASTCPSKTWERELLGLLACAVEEMAAGDWMGCASSLEQAGIHERERDPDAGITARIQRLLERHYATGGHRA